MTTKPQKPRLVKLNRGKIIIDADTQARVVLSGEVIAEYAAAYKAGVELPPVDVFFDGARHYLADGYHRYFGAADAGLDAISCLVHRGTLDDARWFACCANQAHGLRRTADDKARAIKTALRHPKGLGLSDKQLADHLGVSDKTVGKYRAELQATSEIPKSDQRVGKDGRKIKTGRIGKKVKEPRPCPNCTSTRENENGECAVCFRLKTALPAADDDAEPPPAPVKELFATILETIDAAVANVGPMAVAEWLSLIADRLRHGGVDA